VVETLSALKSPFKNSRTLQDGTGLVQKTQGILKDAEAPGGQMDTAINKKRVPRASHAGFAANTLVFILATIGFTAGATVAIIEAYQKWIVEPRTPSEVKRLSEENGILKNKVEQLEDLARRKEEDLWREQILEAAQVVRLTTPAKLAQANHVEVTEAMRRHGLSADENRLLDLQEAVWRVDKAMKQTQSPLDEVFGSGRVDAWRRDLPTYQSRVDKSIEDYRRAHLDRSEIIQRRIDEARDSMKPEER
jgi:hypothetical protein